MIETSTALPAKGLPGARRLAIALPRAWHLLSLDAPTVAATWCAAFLLAAGVSSKSAALVWPVLFLGLATWLCYVGDRVMDARSPVASGLRARHRFYGALWREHRSALLAALGLVTLACAAIALVELPLSLFLSFAALTGVSLVYFGWVHLGPANNAMSVAKEGAVATIFALGCMLPAWLAARPELRLRLVFACISFGVLCWLNCVAIERWESGGSLGPRAHASTHWAARHLALLLVAAAVASGALGLLQDAHAGAALGMFAPCLSGAFLLLAVLEALRLRLSSETLRILADLALLTPLLWWLAAGLAHR